MPKSQTVIALPVSTRVRVRTHKSASRARQRIRTVPASVVPIFRNGPVAPRARKLAGVGVTIALGFSAICWAGLAAIIL